MPVKWGIISTARINRLFLDGARQATGVEVVAVASRSQESAERFAFAAEFGHVWLSNDPATVSSDGTSVVTLGSVYTVVK